MCYYDPSILLASSEVVSLDINFLSSQEEVMNGVTGTGQPTLLFLCVGHST